MIQQTLDFQTLFEALPGNYLVLQPDAPLYTILAVSDDMLHTTGRQREQVVGKSVFEVFPDNPDAITATGPSSLRTSLRNAVHAKKPDQMPVIRYDVRNADGVFEDRYWSAGNKPVLDAAGEVAYLIHSAVEVTERVKADKKESALRKIEKTYNLLMKAPVAVCIVSGPEHVIELVNEKNLELIGRTSDIVGKPFFEALPEARQQGFPELLDRVRTTGEPFYASERPATFRIDGKEEVRYYNFVYQPYYENPGDQTAAGVFTVSHEVTGQVLARKRLEESEARFRNMVEQAPVAITLTRGRDVVIESINAPMLRMVDKENTEAVIGKKMLEVLPEIADQPVLGFVLEVLDTGRAFTGNEVPVTLRVGGHLKEQYFNISYTPFIEDGVVTGVIHVAIDVTEQVATRRKIEESEHRFRSLIEESPVPTALLTGREMVVELANPAMIGIWGKGASVLGKPLLEALPELEGQPFLQILDDVFTTGKTYEARNAPARLVVDGVPGVYYFDFTYKPLFNAAREVYGIMDAAVDVTEQVLARKKLEESEERFRIMADAAPNIIWAVHPDSSIKYVNKSFLEFLGVSLEQFVADNWLPYVHPEDLALTRQTLTGAIENREVFTLEQRLRRHDGEYRWLLAQGAPSYYPDGELYGYVGSAIDITDLKEANAQLVRTNNDLDNFIYTASHDLKAPITNIEGLLKVLLRTLPPESLASERAQQLTGLMQDSVERFKKTIGSLTEVVKLQKENSKETVLVDLAEVIREVRLDLEPIIQSSGARLEADVADCEAIRFSAKNLRSVVYNLLSNAIKYRAPERTPHVLIRCESTSGCHVLTVSDNGLGMEAGHPDQLFTMFKRFHNHVEGSGIGLYMVKKMVDNAGGRIEVESRVGEGSTFRVYFRR